MVCSLNDGPDWWYPIYKDILTEFTFSMEEDCLSARILADILNDRDVIPLPEMSHVAVVGAAVSMHELNKLQNFHGEIIACDGATSALISRGIWPDYIVSDLDGRIEDIITAGKKGAIVFVHAHGDNRELIESYVHHLPWVIGTCQCDPPEGLYNFGGFTDGDRAVAIAIACGARKVELYGFKFDTLGEYSFNSDPTIKMKKLKWARKIIDLLVEINSNSGVEICMGC